MAKKRPTESSWESDEDLLGDGVNAFPKLGDGTEEIDEDALLDSDGEDHQSQNVTGEIVEMVDLGLNVSEVGFDDTANTQELDYEDLPEEAPPEESYEENERTEDTEEPLMVDDQPNQTTCVAQPIEPVEDVGDDEDSDEGGKKKERERFQTERNTVSLSSINYSKSSEIPDSLEITKEMQEEIETFEKKGKGKFHQKTRGQHPGQNRPGQQQYRQQFARPRLQGHPQQMHQGRFMGPRHAGPLMPPRGHHNFGGLRGPPGPRNMHARPQGFQQPLRFPQKMIRHDSSHMSTSGPPTQIPQQMVAMPHQGSPHFQSQSPQYTPPHMDPPRPLFQSPQPPHYAPPQPLLPQSSPQPVQHSQPQPLLQQPVGSTIHVNPNFHGPLPVNIRAPQQQQQQQIPPGSVQQPVYSQQQPIQQYQGQPQQNWPPHSAAVQMSYPQSPNPNPPSLLSTNPPSLLSQPVDARPALLQPPQMTVSRFQGPTQHGGQSFQPRPQDPGFRPQGPRGQTRPAQQLFTHQQMQQQRPLASNSMRGPVPANQMRGNMRLRGAQQAHIRPPHHLNQTPRTQAPGTGWNPPPTELVTKTEEIDPEKLKKQQELEEKKRLRAERFKTNAPVKVEEGAAPKKIVLNPKNPQKRPSGDDSVASDELSPPKIVKLESGGRTMLVKVQKDTDLSALVQSLENPETVDMEKALEEQKKKRELIMKAKEAKRVQEAENRKRLMAKKLVQQAKAKSSAAVTAQSTSNPQGQQVQQPSNHGNQSHFQGHHQFPPQGHQQQNFQQTQQNFQGQQQRRFIQNNGNQGNRGQMSNRGQMPARGQLSSRGNGRGQPISVLGQGGQKKLQGQNSVGHNRGHGRFRGQGQSRGRGRGVQKVQNVVQLQQVELDSIDYDSTDSTPGSTNRTVIPVSSGGRQVVGPGMNPMGAASQGTSDRIVFEKVEPNTPQRRIVIDAKMSSTVLIKDVPKNADIGKIASRCSQFGQTEVFNYKADEKIIVVRFSKPSEAASFLNKSFRFMIDMNYYTAVSVPDSSV